MWASFLGLPIRLRFSGSSPEPMRARALSRASRISRIAPVDRSRSENRTEIPFKPARTMPKIPCPSADVVGRRPVSVLPFSPRESRRRFLREEQIFAPTFARTISEARRAF
jgi:hypothetical protein